MNDHRFTVLPGKRFRFEDHDPAFTGCFHEKREAEEKLRKDIAVNNGVVILKFFLNLSKADQKRRFLERIDTPEKNWKFSGSDVAERAHWEDYRAAYADVFARTSTPWAPWYVIPADNKWFTRLTVADIIVRRLKKLDLHYPRPTDEHRASLLEARELLEREPEP